VSGICSGDVCAECRKNEDKECISDDECCGDMVCTAIGSSIHWCKKPDKGQKKSTTGRRKAAARRDPPPPAHKSKDGCPPGCQPDGKGYCMFEAGKCDRCAGEFSLECDKLDLCHDWVRNSCKRIVQHVVPEKADLLVKKLMDSTVECNRRPQVAVTDYFWRFVCLADETKKLCADIVGGGCKFDENNCTMAMSVLNDKGRKELEKCMRKVCPKTPLSGERAFDQCVYDVLIPNNKDGYPG
jgi:hypothetical protein